MRLQSFATRALGALVVAGGFLVANNAHATTAYNIGAFQAWGGGTSDSGYGLCMENDSNLLYEEGCDVQSSGAVGYEWNVTGIKQNFQLNSYGQIISVDHTDTTIGCLDIVNNVPADGVQIYTPAQGGCGTTNHAELWYFLNGNIIPQYHDTYCLTASSQGTAGTQITLETCNGSYSQIFLPINISVAFQSSSVSGDDLDISDDNYCPGTGNTAALDSWTNNGTNAQAFLFEPYEVQYYHAALMSQNPSGTTTDAYGDCIEMNGDASGDTFVVVGDGTCGDETTCLGDTTASYAYQYTGAYIVNSQFKTVETVNFPFVIENQGHGDDVLSTTTEGSAETWGMTILNFPSAS